MSRPTLEVAHLLEHYQQAFLHKYPQPAHHLRTLQALSQCRTAALGGHLDACGTCGSLRISYNSCRNRHCPKCQGLQRHRWVQRRLEELLPVPYFHLVFTLPHELNELALYYPQLIYKLLFHAAWHTLQTLGKDPKRLGAQMGMTAVLHTWGQNLQLHPHLHCIVPAGGITKQGRWKGLPYADKYLFAAKVLQHLFRATFLRKLQACIEADQIMVNPHNWKVLKRKLYRKKWVVFAKRPFAGPQQVVNYLGKYTHRIAISNQRLIKVQQDRVYFHYKDYRKGHNKVMKLEVVEFLRRFCLHILPLGFRRIRHYGFLSNGQKSHMLALARQSLAVAPLSASSPPDWEELLEQVTNKALAVCPTCQSPSMRRIGVIPRQRAPPPGVLPHWIPIPTP